MIQHRKGGNPRWLTSRDFSPLSNSDFKVWSLPSSVGAVAVRSDQDATWW